MRNNLRILGLSALTGLMVILPFFIMEIVNRRIYNEDFPFMLFFVLWLNTFIICIILLPVVLGWRAGKQAQANLTPAQGLAKPIPAAITGIILILFPFILIWMESLGWVPLNLWVYGPDPEVTYLPGLFISLGLYAFPVAGGIIAGRPVVRTLRAGGSLFAYPVHLIIVVLLVAVIAFGLASLIIDQWPCFIGVLVCD